MWDMKRVAPRPRWFRLDSVEVEVKLAHNLTPFQGFFGVCVVYRSGFQIPSLGARGIESHDHSTDNLIT